MFSPPSGPHGGPNNQIPKQICAHGSLLNIYVLFLFLEAFVSQKYAKNQYALLPEYLSRSWYPILAQQ